MQSMILDEARSFEADIVCLNANTRDSFNEALPQLSCHNKENRQTPESTQHLDHVHVFVVVFRDNLIILACRMQGSRQDCQTPHSVNVHASKRLQEECLPMSRLL